MSNFTEFGIFMTLLDGKVHKASDLADKFEVSTKTIYRQTNKLVYAGFPVSTTAGKNGGIFLASKYSCSTWFFSEEELAYLFNLVASNQGHNITLNNIIKCKLENHIKNNGFLSASKNLCTFFVDNSSWFSLTKKEEKLLSSLLLCCANNYLVNITYKNTERTVEPYAIVSKEGAYYLYAYCLSRQDYRLFKLKRITNFANLNKPFQKREIDLESKPWNNTSFSQTTITLMADENTIKDIESWTSPKKVCENTYQIAAVDNIGLIHKLMEYGNKIKIVSPTKIIENITNECKNICHLYS